MDADLISKAERVADDVSAAFVGREGVVGVLYIGALARGYFDEHSDIDIVVYKRRGVRLGWPHEKEYAYKGFQIDLEVRCYERDLHRAWSFEERWNFLKARIKYDPEGLVRGLIELKVPLREGERAKVIEEEVRRASWSISDIGAWLYRNDPLSARYAAVTALKHLLRALAALNWIPPPPDKWLARVALSVENKPPSIQTVLYEVLARGGLDAETIARVKNSLESLKSWVLSARKAESGLQNRASSGHAPLRVYPMRASDFV